MFQKAKRLTTKGTKGYNTDLLFLLCFINKKNKPIKEVVMELSKSYLLDLTYKVNGAAIEVHKTLGPGLLESVYKHCLKQELTLRGISFVSEIIVPIHYKGIYLEAELRCDIFVENCLVIELKAIENVLPIHEAQLLSYMQLLEAPKGILFNFHTVNLYKEGQRTFVNDFFKKLKEE